MNGQDPDYYDCINRNAIVVKVKKPLFDWLNSVSRDEILFSGDEEGTIYLLREMDSNEETDQWLKRNFDKIFKSELISWHTNKQDWPKNRTFGMFKEWFDYDIISLVYDLEKTDILKDL